MTARRYCDLSNWAPAFAGVVPPLSKLPTAPLFSREGGSPVWIPAFAGKQSLSATCVNPNPR